MIMKQVREDTGIVHLRVPAHIGLRDFLISADLAPLDVTPAPALVDEWLHYGSVYADGVRMRADQALMPGQIVRLHTRRKTYFPHAEALRGRIVFEHEDFLVFDKPSGLPTHATLDNAIENAAHLLSAELAIPLYVTSRLDVATRGLLIFAKNPSAQAALNKRFARRQIEKFYTAKVSGSVALGWVTHWMNPESRVPKEMSATEQPGWWECRMEILANDHGVLTIQLHTGKTHQIRAQLSALGAPIDGDATYGSKVNAPRESQIALECARLRFSWRQTEMDIKLLK